MSNQRQFIVTYNCYQEQRDLAVKRGMAKNGADVVDYVDPSECGHWVGPYTSFARAVRRAKDLTEVDTFNEPRVEERTLAGKRWVSGRFWLVQWDTRLSDVKLDQPDGDDSLEE